MLVIPKLCHLPFHRIDASLSVAFDQLSDSECEDSPSFENAQMARIVGERLVFATLETGAEQGDEGGLRALLSLSFEQPPPGPEFHVLAAQPGQNWGFSLGTWEQSDPDNIWNPLSVFLGKTVSLFAKASFTVDRESLPADSLVASMIGLRTKAGEEQFLLSGAQLAVRGFPDDTISWYLKPGSHGQKVSGEVTRQWVEKFHSESIDDAVHVLEARFNRVARVESSIRHATA